MSPTFSLSLAMVLAQSLDWIGVRVAPEDIQHAILTIATIATGLVIAWRRIRYGGSFLSLLGISKT